jgi:ribosomal protein L16/L10AE
MKGRNAGVASRGTEINFGKYGLKSLENERITSFDKSKLLVEL